MDNSLSFLIHEITSSLIQFKKEVGNFTSQFENNPSWQGGTAAGKSRDSIASVVLKQKRDH